MMKNIVNDVNMKKMSSIHVACLSGNVQVVKMLLDNGADLHKRDYNLFLPLHYAVIKDNVNIVELL